MNWHQRATSLVRRAISKRAPRRGRRIARRVSRVEGFLQFAAMEPLEQRMMLSASIDLLPDANDGTITVESGVTVLEVPAGGVTIDIIAQLAASDETINGFQLDFTGSTVAAGQLELSNWNTDGAWQTADGSLGAGDFDVAGAAQGGVSAVANLGVFSVTIPNTPGDYRVDLGPGAGTSLVTGIFPPTNVTIDDYGDLIIRVPGAVVPTISISDVIVGEGNKSLPLTTTLSGTVRDFIGTGTTSANQGGAAAHPDFENSTFLAYRINNPGVIDAGLVGPTLGVDGNPVFASTGSTLTGSSDFNQWYNDDASVNMSAPLSLTLQQGSDASRFVYNGTGGGEFYPIDNQLFGNTQGADILGTPVDPDHNWDFTYEAHSTFVYQGGETITVSADDDFWLFIDGDLVLDRGGVNIAITRTVELDDLGLTPGQTYDFDMFYAERHTLDAVLTIDTDILLGMAAADIPNFAEFTVSLSEATTNTVTVDFSTLDATAIGGSDFLPSTGSVTFAPGETSKTVRVPLLGDAVDETNEFFVLSLSNPTNATIFDGEGVATIIDDDAPSSELMVTVNYSRDTNNFFDTQAKRDLLESAIDSIVSRFTDDLAAINATGGNSWNAVFFDPATGNQVSLPNIAVAANELIIFAGGRALGSLGVGGPGGFSGSGQQAFLDNLGSRGQAGALDAPETDFGPWGGSITFNTSSNWHFGETTDGLSNGENDFYSVALHEFTHLLGLGTADSWETYVDAGTMTFTGPASVAEYDGEGNVPLNAGLGHWAANTMDGGQEAAMDPNLLQGTRKLMTDLDFAGLADVGWQLADVTVATSTIAGRVFSDSNGDGIENGSDAGIVGVNVDLYLDNNNDNLVDGNDTLLFSSVTDNSGDYSFGSLEAGEYVVVVNDTGNVLDGFIATNLPNGTDATLGEDDTFTDGNFGFLLLPTVTLAAPDSAATESGDTGIFTFTRTGDTSNPLDVTYTIAGTATNGADYQTLTGTVTIAAGSATATVVITPLQDQDNEGNESVLLTVVDTDPATYLVGQGASAMVNIADDDLPTILLALTDDSASEEGDTASYAVTRTGSTEGDLSVFYTLSGTATNGDDYQLLSGTVVIPDGLSSAQILITPIDDNVDDDDETVLVSLTPHASYALGQTTTNEVTITDNDSPIVLPTVAIDVVEQYAIEGGRSAQVIFSRSGTDTDETLVVAFNVSGTAFDTTDYQSISTGGLGTVTIPQGQSSVTLDINPVTDNIEEQPEESVNLTLATDDAYAIDDQMNSTQVLIVDADQFIPIVLVEKVSDAMEEGEASGTFRLHRLGQGSDEILVSFLMGGTALLGVDYNASQFNSVAIPQGADFVDVVITPIDDATGEGDEDVTLQITPGGAYQLTDAARSATMQIVDSSTLADGEISGVKFEDINGNGVRDDGEPGVAGITITLASTGGETQTLTNDDGEYSFTGLAPGTYTVEEIVPEGSAASTPITVEVLLPASGTAVVNFGNYVPGSISGIKFNDLNGDGTQDDGETGVEGITITLDGPGGVQTLVTGADGTYSFVALAPGSYNVSETVPAGSQATTPTSVDLLILSGDDLQANFGNREIGGRIVGIKFHDLNANGVQDAGEPGLEGVSINVQGNGVDTTVVTGADGTYAVTALEEGDYVVTETVPNGFLASTPTSVNAAVPDQGEAVVNFGNYKPGKITGNKYHDLDGDGVRDDNEPGLADVMIAVTGGGQTFNLVTDSEGNYELDDLTPGAYTVDETLPEGFFASTATTFNVDVVSDQTVAAPAIGNYQKGSISGVKYFDEEGNGVIDLTDSPFGPGATIQLTGPGGLQQTFTGLLGDYVFANLDPGFYFVQELPIDGLVQTFPRPPIYLIALASGEHRTDVDFANADTVELLLDYGDAPATFPTLAADNGAVHRLGGSLFLGALVDAESDGQPTVTALGDDLAGAPDDEDGVTFDTPLTAGLDATITVTASTAGQLDAWIDFNGDGAWDASEQIFDDFALAAGSNVLTFTVPASAAVDSTTYARFRVSTEGDLEPDGFALDGEVEDYAVDIFAAGSISGVKFEDVNGNGVQDAGEPSLAGVVIIIDSDNNGAFDSGERFATTLLDGSFSFDDLAPGDHTLVEIVPAGMAPTVPATGSQVVTVSSGQAVTGVTFGNQFTTPRPDLVGAFVGEGLGDEVVPGDKFTLEVEVTNNGTAEAKGKTTIKVYLVPDGEELDPNSEPAAVIKAGINLDIGESKIFKGKFQVPDTAPTGGFRLVAVVDADEVIEESNEGNNDANSAASTVVYKVGQVGDRTVKKLTVAGITYQLSGAGTATVIPGGAGEAPSILVEGSDTGSQLKVKAGKDATAEVNDVTANGSLKKIDLSKFKLLGDILVTGTVDDVRLGDVDAQHLITIQSAGVGQTFSLRAAQVRDLSIDSAMPIKQIQVDDWDDTDETVDQITAPSLEQIKSKSDLGASITLTDITAELKKVDVKENLLGSVIRTLGDIGSVKAGRIVDSSIFAGIDDDVTGLPDDEADFITGAAIGQVQAKGVKNSPDASFENSRIAASIVGKVKLSDVEFDNDGELFGIAADTRIDQVQRSDADKVGPVLTPALADEQGDYVVRVV